MGGLAEVDSKVYFASRTLNSLTSNVETYVNKFHDANSAQDFADHNDAISFSYKTHWEALNSPSSFKKFLRLKVFSLDISNNDFETNNFSLDVTTEHDFAEGSVSSLSMDFSGGATGWGNSPWGDFPWGENRLPAVKRKLLSRKAKSLRVILENTDLDENILISGMELEIETPFQERIKE